MKAHKRKKMIFSKKVNIIIAIQSLYQSLLPRKGYIAATEAQLSLSLLLAERVFDSVSATTIQRCHNAASRLRPSKLRDQLLDEIKKNT